MNEIINIIPISPVNFEFQEYNSDDLSLIQTQEVENSFNPETDYIGTSTITDTTVQALIDEITQLRQENLDLQQQLLSGSLKV